MVRADVSGACVTHNSQAEIEARTRHEPPPLFLNDVKSINKIFKLLTSVLSNLNNFLSLEVVGRVIETQLTVDETPN